MDLPHSQNCLKCHNSFTPHHLQQIYCKVRLEIICEICERIFNDKCHSNTKRTCSKSCGSKIIRKEQGENNRKHCKKCGKHFNPQNQKAEYCNAEITIQCQGCPKHFQRLCNNDSGSYCNSSCRNTYMRKHHYKIKEKRLCILCDHEFEPNMSQQTTCANEHYSSCQICSHVFAITSNHSQQYCSNSCSTIAQTNSAIASTLLHEYKNPNQWAMAFKKHRKRKPTRGDFQAYFNVQNLPKAFDLRILRKTKSSRWESHVVQYIETEYPQYRIQRNKKLLKFPNDKHLKEIDVYLPEISIGFEVQDFATHSRTNDNEQCENHWRKKRQYKSGPTYHRSKKQAAQKISIQIYEIWEDEIINSTYKDKITQIISQQKQVNSK